MSASTGTSGRRQAIVYLTPDLLIESCKPHPPSWVRVVSDGLPADARVVTCFYDHSRASIAVVLESVTFAVVEPGNVLPVLRPPTMELVMMPEPAPEGA